MKLYLAGLFILAGLSTPAAFADGSQYALSFPSLARCDLNLKSLPVDARWLEQTFRRYEFSLRDGEAGFVLDPKSFPLAVPHKNFVWNGHGGYDRILSPEYIQLGDRRYQVFDVGFKNLEQDALDLNSLVLDQMMKNPNQPIEVEYSAHRRMVENILFKYRWGLHLAVLNLYRMRKPYLKENDFSLLTEVNTKSDNSDVFGLLTYDPQSPRISQFEAGDIFRRAAMSVQVTYPGNRNFLYPSLKGLVLALGHEPDDAADLLPFEYRVSRTDRKAIHAEVFSKFDARATCEIIRYAKFESDLPDPVRDRVLYDMFVRIRSRGMKTILASLDTYTLRAFRKYGFRPLMKLPTNQTVTAEYLSFLNVSSPEFKQTLKNLALSSSAATIVRSGAY